MDQSCLAQHLDPGSVRGTHLRHDRGGHAQPLAQTRPGAKGALLVSAALPASELGGSSSRGTPLQIHMMEGDEYAVEDLPAARELAETVDGAQLFLLASHDGHPIPGVFNVDPARAVETYAALTALDPGIACFGHGAPLLDAANDRLRRADPWAGATQTRTRVPGLT